MIKTLDVIQLKGGHIATVLEVYNNGRSCLVEITDASGKTIDIRTVTPEDIEKIIWVS